MSHEEPEQPELEDWSQLEPEQLELLLDELELDDELLPQSPLSQPELDEDEEDLQLSP